VAGIGAAYLAFWQVAPRVRTDGIYPILVSTLISLALIVWFPARFAQTYRRPRVLAISLLVSGAAVLPLQVMGAMGRSAAPWSLMGAVPGLPGLLFIWFAASAGALLSFVLRGANMIPPVAAVLALVDIWTVLLGGPVQKIMASENPTAKAITTAMQVRLPRPAVDKVGATPLYVNVGFADFLFIAFFVAAMCRFAPGPRTYPRMVRALILVLCSYMLVVMWREINLPALAPMAIAMIALHWKHFHYERSEVFALVYAAVFIAAIALGFWFLAGNGGRTHG
jgi:hypothetical protein